MKKQTPIHQNYFFYRHHGQKKQKKLFTLPNSLRCHTEGELAGAAATEEMNLESIGVTVPERGQRDSA